MTYRLRIGTASRTCAGQDVCGDQFGVFRAGRETFIVVADGLGHGPEANEAACVACDFVEKNRTRDLKRLLTGVDKALAHTRGAAVTIVYVEMLSGEIIHTGVGNVQLASRSRKPISPIPVPGVVGSGVRKILISQFQLNDGDFFVVYTDGISSRFDLGNYVHLDPQRAADQLVERWSRSHDDATCVAVQVRS